MVKPSQETIGDRLAIVEKIQRDILVVMKRRFGIQLEPPEELDEEAKRTLEEELKMSRRVIGTLLVSFVVLLSFFLCSNTVN